MKHEDLLSYYQATKGIAMEFLSIIVFIVLGVLINNFKRKLRRDYYRNDYLKSDAWQRKRYLVLKRDNWRCVYCGARAT